mgnify:FL=1
MKIAYDVFRTKKESFINETWVCNEKFGNDETRRLFYELRLTRNENAISKLGYELIEIYYNSNNIIYEYKFNPDLPVAPNFERFWIEYSPVVSKKCKYCHFRHKHLNWCMMKNKEITKDSHFKCMLWFEIRTEDIEFVYQHARSEENDGANRGILTYKGF